jgi:anti-sigma B factor antagonist
VNEPLQFALVQEDVDEHTVVIVVEGELEITTAPRFKQLLVKAVDERKRAIVVDFSRLSFIDSTALGVLIAAQRRMHDDDARLAIVCTHPQVLNVFEITGIDTAFRIHPDRAAALAQVRAANLQA